MSTRAFPEALPGKRGDDWSVRTSPALSAMTNMTERIMMVPGGDETVAFALRMRELAHAAHSPVSDIRKLCERNGVTVESLIAAEQARLNKGLVNDDNIPYEYRRIYARGVVTDQMSTALRMQLTEMAKVHPEEALMFAIRMYAAHYYTADNERVARAIAEVWPHPERGSSPWTGGPTAKEVRSEYLMDPMIQMMLQEVGAVVASVYRKAGPPESPAYPRFARAVDLARKLDEFMAKAPKPAKEFDPKALDTEGDALKRFKERSSREANVWGEMTIVRPELVEEYEIKKRVRVRRQLDFGSSVNMIDRLLVDERIFAEQRFRSAGTVLIDCSGSMGLGPEDVRKLVLSCPSVTVAGYSGSGRVGELVILAEKGKIIDKDDFNRFHGGNIVDGPALQWLASMPGPRIWVSDGGVTGIGDHMTPNLVVEALNLQLANHITRLRDFERTAATLQELRKIKS